MGCYTSYMYQILQTIILAHLRLDEMAAISQTTFSSAYSLMKSFVFL